MPGTGLLIPVELDSRHDEAVSPLTVSPVVSHPVFENVDGQQVCSGARSRENGEGQQSEQEELENRPLPPDTLVQGPFSPTPSIVYLEDKINEGLKGAWTFCQKS